MMQLDEILNRFYNKLYNKVFSESKKGHSSSVLITLLGMRSNNASKLLNDASVRPSIDDRELFRELEGKKLIRQSDNSTEEYVLTAFGLWKIEKSTKNLTEEDLISYFQSTKNFTPTFSDKGLNDKEKLIVLSLIASRVFSASSQMDLNKENTRNYWLDIFKSTSDFLRNHGLIKMDDKCFSKQGNEHPIPYLMFRANELPKRTRQIFCFTGSRQYYLSILEENELSVSKLKFLFKLVFSDITDLGHLETIMSFCRDLAYEKGKFVSNNFMFIDAKTDAVIKEALQQLYTEN
jgi:hypothetical protein